MNKTSFAREYIELLKIQIERLKEEIEKLQQRILNQKSSLDIAIKRKE